MKEKTLTLIFTSSFLSVWRVCDFLLCMCVLVFLRFMAQSKPQISAAVAGEKREEVTECGKAEAKGPRLRKTNGTQEAHCLSKSYVG